MESTSHNTNRAISAVLAIALIWIFWPILSPTMMFLNTIAFLPFSIIFILVGTVGEPILFTISLGCCVLLIRDVFGRFGQEDISTSDEALENEITSTTEKKVDVEEEIECHEIPSDSLLPEEELENPVVTDEVLEPPQVDDAPISSDADLLKSLAVQDVLDEVCQDIINNRDAEDELEVPVAPSAC